MLQVVTDIVEIVRHTKRLEALLTQRFPVTQTRDVGFPSAHRSHTVRFEQRGETEVRAWAVTHEASRTALRLLAGATEHAEKLQILLLLSFPLGEYSRRVAGVFVRDSVGNVVIGHRGPLTRGNAKLKSEKVLEHFAERVATVDDDGSPTKIALVAGLEDPELVPRLWEFAASSREVADAVSRDERPRSMAEGSRGPTGATRLREYVDEFEGERAGAEGGDAPAIAFVEHGAIVRSLSRQLIAHGHWVKNSKAIDLAVLTHGRLHLFEVKTSQATTDIYTGCGQLMLHGEALAAALKRPVSRYLVLPEAKPNRNLHNACKTLGIELVMQRRRGGDGPDYVFGNLALLEGDSRT